MNSLRVILLLSLYVAPVNFAQDLVDVDELIATLTDSIKTKETYNDIIQALETCCTILEKQSSQLNDAQLETILASLENYIASLDVINTDNNITRGGGPKTVTALQIKDRLRVLGSAVILGNFDVRGQARVGRELLVEGNIGVAQNVDIGGYITGGPDNNLVINSDTTINGILTVNGAVPPSGNTLCGTPTDPVEIGGIVNIGCGACPQADVVTMCNPTIIGDALVTGNLNVGGSQIVSGNLNVGGNELVAGDLTVTGTITSSGAISIVTTFCGTVATPIEIGGTVNIGCGDCPGDDVTMCNPTISGATLCGTVATPVDIGGTVTIGCGTCPDADLITICNPTISGGALVTGNLNVVGNEVITGDLTVTGTITSSTITPVVTTFCGTVATPIEIGGTVNIGCGGAGCGPDDVTICNPTISGNAIVTGNLNVGGSEIVTGNLNVSGSEVITGDLTVTGTITQVGGACLVTSNCSSTDNAIARWDGVTGTVIQDSLLSIDDLTGTIRKFPATSNFLYISSVGTQNMFAGVSSGNTTMSGTDNAGFGFNTLTATTSGGFNTAVGSQALDANTTGTSNTAIGFAALTSNTIGGQNTALGAQALQTIITGTQNTAVGYQALFANTGSSNIAVGVNAGAQLTTGNSNIDIGNIGVAAESNTIRIGTLGTQTRNFIQGIFGVTPAGSSTPVVIDANGQLGTQGSTCIVTSTCTSTDNAIARWSGITGTQIKNSILTVDDSGFIRQSNNLYISNFGTQNMFAGINSGNTIMTGTNNAGFGNSTLTALTTGFSNTAVGYQALTLNTTGTANTAIGAQVLTANIIGNNNTGIGSQALFQSTASQNTAVGSQALFTNVSGTNNTAVGYQALTSSTGTNNIALGNGAGSALTTTSNNIIIGNNGVLTDANTIKIGTAGSQTRCFIAGIRGVTTGSATGITVLIDTNGQLGTVSSSRRFKENIVNMDTLTNNLMQLRPVAFNYKKEFGGDGLTREYGLIAEEVAKIYPDLVVNDEDGQPYTIRYHLLPSMLLNELQKLHHEVHCLDKEVAELKQIIA